MSSMLRIFTAALLFTTACAASPAQCQEAHEWEQARARLMQSHDQVMHQAIDRWALLSNSGSFSFDDYAGFLLTYPSFPREEQIRTYAEAALERTTADPRRLVAFFEKYPPLTNPARARHALALASLSYPGARETAVKAWRGGTMSETAESTLLFNYGQTLSRADHDARMDALLWDGDTRAAERQISRVSPENRNVFMARLSLLQGSPAGALGIPITGEMLRDPGYIYNRVVQERRAGNLGSAIALLANRAPLAQPARDAEKWVKELLTAARGAGSDPSVRIASQIDDAFPPGTNISRQSFRLRDDYTSLMWLGGTNALWNLGDARRAAPLFYRYGAAAQTPGTRSKGFYWAGRALAQAGDREGAKRYFEEAGEYADQFYGMLALERLGRPLPSFNATPSARPSREQREEFLARPITRAVREAARDHSWRTTVQFFRAISDQARSESDHVLVAELAQEIGRRDLAVILGQAAQADGHGGFQSVAFPLVTVPPGANFTMVHAITRQESQFAQNAISHAGARGLMQLMPGTAREQAAKMGMSYSLDALISDPQYNIRLGNGYFGRMMDYYGGAYPLAVGAYNAGPGNVNKWLRANGDPRQGGVDWVTWIERIPIYETRNYIQRVLENAVVYHTMNPGRYFYRGDTPLSHFLGKREPG